jgi:hypothetical protein
MSSQFGLLSIGIAVLIFVALIVFLDIGWRIGIRQAAKRGEASRAGVGVVDGVVFSLLGLLIGFTFSGAAGRFDKRRELMVTEVNAIHTSWKRIDLLPADMQPAMRTAYRRYVDALLAAYGEEARSPAELKHRFKVRQAQDEIWTRTVAASLDDRGDKARVLIIPTANLMFDAVTSEHLAQQLHPPMIVYVMLSLALLAGVLFAGYAMSRTPTRNWLHIIGVAASLAIACYVILELESPRLGLVRVDAIDGSLADLRAAME